MGEDDAEDHQAAAQAHPVDLLEDDLEDHQAAAQPHPVDLLEDDAEDHQAAAQPCPVDLLEDDTEDHQAAAQARPVNLLEDNPEDHQAAAQARPVDVLEFDAEDHQAAAQAHPVDLLEDDAEVHQAAAQAYYASLKERAPTAPEIFCLPTGEQVKLETSSLYFCTVYRDEPQHKILVLVNPQDTKTVVAVYLKESWWSTEDVLRTSDPTRKGLMKVRSFGERIVLFILNVIIFGRLERSLDDEDMFFLPHPAKEQAKILWRDGAAVGFYSTKMKGSLCGSGTSVCYELPVLDTVFVRKKCRRQGLGTAMLQDFCDTFQEDEALGVSFPISPSMCQVLRKFLLARPAQRGRLWEVEPPGTWGQRVNIWLKVYLQEASLPDGSIVHPGCTEEDTSKPWRTSQDDQPVQWNQGESHKEETTGEELETTETDQDCEVREEIGGLPVTPCQASLEGKGAKRTVAVSGLGGKPWWKHMRPSS